MPTQIEEEVSSEEMLHLAMEMYDLTELEVRRLRYLWDVLG